MELVKIQDDSVVGRLAQPDAAGDFDDTLGPPRVNKEVRSVQPRSPRALKELTSLHHLDCRHNAIDDFSVLKDVPLKFIWCDDPDRRLHELQQISTLRRINGKPVPWKPAVEIGPDPGMD